MQPHYLSINIMFYKRTSGVRRNFEKGGNASENFEQIMCFRVFGKGVDYRRGLGGGAPSGWRQMDSPPAAGRILAFFSKNYDFW